MKLGFGLSLSALFKIAGGQAPALSNDNSTITAAGGAPAAPSLTNDNSTITAEAA